MSTARGRRFFGWREILASLIVLAVYSVCLYRMPYTFWSPDEGCKFMQSKTIRWDGGIDYVLPYPGLSIDPEARFYVGHMWGRTIGGFYPLERVDGVFHFHWPIWFPLLVKVPVELLGPFGGFLVAMLAGWLVAILSGRLAGELDRNLAAPAILVVGLATPIWFFSLSFWEHTTSVLLALLAIHVLVRGRADLRALLLSLLPAVAAVMMRLELAAVAIALCVAFVVAALQRALTKSSDANVAAARVLKRPSLGTILGLIGLVVVLLVMINLTLTGRHSNMVNSIPARLQKLSYLPTLLKMLTTSPFWIQDSMLKHTDASIVWAAVICCVIAPLFRWRWIEAPLAIFGLVVYAIYSGELYWTSRYYRSIYGLFPIAPFMLLAAYGVRRAWQQRDSGFFIFTVASLTCTALSFWAMAGLYRGSGQLSLGLTWGQRYVLVLYPLLSVLGVAGVQAIWRSGHYLVVRLVMIGLALALVAIGIGLEVRGFDESRGTRRMLAAWQEAMEGQAPIITDVWWLPAGVADFYVREKAFAVSRRRQVADWVREVNGRGVTGFTFVSLAPVSTRDFSDPPPNKMVRRSVRRVRGLYLTRFSFLERIRRPALR